MFRHSPGPIFSNAGEPAFLFLTHKSLWIGAGLILLSRLCLLYFSEWLAGVDSARYMQEGINLALYSVFSHSHAIPPLPTAHDLPLYPLLLAFFYKLTADAALCALLGSLSNALFYSIAIIGVYGIAILLSKHRLVAIIAIVVMGIMPEGIPYSIFYMPESLFIALFVWSNFFLILYLRGSHLYAALLAALLLGASILSKPISLFYIFVYGLILLLYPRKKPLRHKLYLLFFVVAVEIIVLSPWIVRNYLAFGFPHLTTILGSNLQNVNLARMRTDMGHRKQSSVAGVQQKKQQKNLIKKAHKQEKDAIVEILSNFPNYLYTLAKRHPRLYLGTGTVATLRLLGHQETAKLLAKTVAKPSIENIKATPISAIILQLSSWVILFTVYLLSLLGLWRITATKEWFTAILLGLGFLYFAAVIGPLTSSRYRFVMIPFFALFSGYGGRYLIMSIRDKIRNQSPYPVSST